MTDEKILTKHPQGKSGRNISKETYETLKTAILAALRKSSGSSFQEKHGSRPGSG